MAEYEWDNRKAAANLRKHGVSFDEAFSVFMDPLATTYADPDHSNVEDRELIVGLSVRRRILVVCYAVRAGTVRITSARRATRRERRTHEEDTER